MHIVVLYEHLLFTVTQQRPRAQTPSPETYIRRSVLMLGMLLLFWVAALFS